MTRRPASPNADPTQLGKVLAQAVDDNKFLAAYTGLHLTLRQSNSDLIYGGAAQGANRAIRFQTAISRKSGRA